MAPSPACMRDDDEAVFMHAHRLQNKLLRTYNLLGLIGWLMAKLQLAFINYLFIISAV
jgi:hypothetical protein